MLDAEPSEMLGHPSEMPQDPFFEAVTELDKVTAVDCLRANGRLDYLIFGVGKFAVIEPFGELEGVEDPCGFKSCLC